ncbi:MAG TPA: class I SAM-dependent methyltransferase [Kineosporiaceae bacterium]|jgi:2-polyprenyl-3-methyl-5-hydroxy-6-metoxy-1,4-benzoquinol methylase|nr:class I SAM-dependent methyltransferase [Kineosporiaceae bacterium]
MSINEQKLEAFVHQTVADMGVAISGALVHIGDKLGLYKAMAGAGPLTSTELADRTGTTERYVREWLNNQAAGGYVSYDPATVRYELPDEHAMVLADENSPVFLCGGFEVLTAGYLGESMVTEAFRTGAGVGYHEHDHRLFRGTERFFRPGYRANLVSGWLPALDGVIDKLTAGATVADIGCGYGASTIVLAQAFPASRFVGYDSHDVSIVEARKAAADAGVADRVGFEVAAAKDYPGTGYDLVTVFDALHDMGDPVGAARHVLSTLAPDGTWLIVEPYAGDHTEDNHHPLGRAFYGFSTLFCTPSSLAQDVGLGLGAQAGEPRLRQVLIDAGFTRIRQAAATPLNLILEARP